MGGLANLHLRIGIAAASFNRIPQYIFNFMLGNTVIINVRQSGVAISLYIRNLQATIAPFSADPPLPPEGRLRSSPSPRHFQGYLQAFR
jgi:hypothetical protein